MEKINGKKYRVIPGQQDPLAEFDFFSRTLSPDGVIYETYDTCHEVVTKVLEDQEKYEVEDLPGQGESVEAGKLYLYGTDVYRVEVSHKVTGNNPEDEVPELYTIYRPNPKALGWLKGEHVEKLTERRYKSKTYRCNIAHITAIGLEPDTDWPEESIPYWTEI